MTTTSYTDNLIFENAQLNAVIDLIFAKVTEQFPAVGPDTDNEFVFKSLILSGDGAYNIQNMKDEAIKSIVFQCDNQVIYDWIALNYQSIIQSSGIIFQERILLYPFGFYIEIWFSIDALLPITAENIFMQRLSDIPSYLKS